MPGIPGRPVFVRAPDVAFVHMMRVARLAQNIREPLDRLVSKIDLHRRRYSLFDGDGLGEIAWLIHVFAFDVGDVICE
jgi:hypothetical protein